jgi:excisionase family DNA binding protein
MINMTLPLEVTGESILAKIMTTKEMAKYLKLHQITICKLSKEAKIPSVKIGSRWRFDKEVPLASRKGLPVRKLPKIPEPSSQWDVDVRLGA